MFSSGVHKKAMNIALMTTRRINFLLVLKICNQLSKNLLRIGLYERSSKNTSEAEILFADWSNSRIPKRRKNITFRRIDQKEKLRSFSRNVAELSPKDWGMSGIGLWHRIYICAVLQLQATGTGDRHDFQIWVKWDRKNTN